ncbi:MAG: PAS domain S-box protein [Proteobacteria bacterium]|nr:PAS domain S-box protein [Pseudomonadota bacterium]MBU1640531.1 PAS domain S-box protein [Pseudomonadota bacterium]
MQYFLHPFSSMNLRYLIFFTITALGLLPLAVLLLTSLPQAMEQLDDAARLETVARTQNRYTKLNAKVTCLKKSIIRLAAVPVSEDIIIQAGKDPQNRMQLLIADWFADDLQIDDVQFVDIVGNETFRMSRDSQGLAKIDESQLTTREQNASFLQGLQLAPKEVFVGIENQTQGSLGSEEQYVFYMVTPIGREVEEVIGVAVIQVNLSTFLQDFNDSLWLLTNRQVLYAPAQIPPYTPPTAIAEDFSQPADISIIDSSTGNQVAWLPLSFNPDHRPLLWIASPIDQSATLAWKSAITRNIFLIVTITGLMVFGIAHFIASHLATIKNEIVHGVDRILNHDEPVQFSWQGPQELKNLAQDLTSMADHYHDIQTARSQAEIALRESEENFRNLTTSAHDAIIMMDHHGDISFWNKAAETFFGYQASEAMGQPIHSLISPRRPETGEGVFPLGEASTGSPVHEIIALIATRKDGTEIQVELSLSAAYINDRWHALWIVRDITERIRAEAKNRDQQQQLIQADKMISLGLLVSGVAHEINNPNSIVLLNTPLLARSWASILPILDEFYDENGEFLVGGLDYSEMRSQIPKICDEIEDSGRRIKQIVMDLKDYARQDSASHFDQIDLNSVVEAASRLTLNKIKNATNHFSTKLSEIPAVFGNRQRLEQVVINLIQNSCEAISGPEKALTITTAFDQNENLVKLVVIDEGSGIDPQSITKVTDPFYTSKRTMGGTGLGLSVSAGIIKEHDATLQFQSDFGKGTTVTIAFKPADNSRSASGTPL